ncbi:MAG: sigma-70 family RNA polymerase sigma factor [Candidatus Cryptobacteroides sp.]|nr:sigma-70 family RNA polymerase sigma factor [Bacteroides sp.]MDY5301920.1 sigma-70 family RNA polymerase sigma factor [Candidatus Cryptobacteroides sp.]
MKEDQILIEQLNASSMEAFSALYDKYAGMVFNFTLSILKDDCISEDITQSCFALMWSRRASISPDGNLPAWLYVVARNAVFKEVRRQVTASKYLDYLSNNDNADSQENDLTERDTAVIMSEAEAAIDALPESRRKIYKMRFIEGLSVHEISERLDISPKTVETQIARAKNAIRQRISELLMLAAILGPAKFL